EQFEYLVQIRFRVGLHLLRCERRASLGLSGRVAYKSSKAADQEDGRVAFVLKMLEFAQHNGVAEMQIGRRGINAELDAQWFTRGAGTFELGAQLFFANNFGRAFAQGDRKSVV